MGIRRRLAALDAMFPILARVFPALVRTPVAAALSLALATGGAWLFVRFWSGPSVRSSEEHAEIAAEYRYVVEASRGAETPRGRRPTGVRCPLQDLPEARFPCFALRPTNSPFRPYETLVDASRPACLRRSPPREGEALHYLSTADMLACRPGALLVPRAPWADALLFLRTALSLI